MNDDPTTKLRRGWTTGACATAATKAALMQLWGGAFPGEVQITLPRGETPVFSLALAEAGEGWARVGITKDAGDDPDVTHGALIIVTVSSSDSGVQFVAGEGVGTVTKAGLPIGVGEPAINPVPRQMMQGVVAELAAIYDRSPDVTIAVSIPGGESLAQKTWNPRLGIAGGLSILGTTGIVRPFSCAAWIASIHRGIDVARADGLPHVAGCTGATSEQTVQTLYDLPDHAMLDMGDFAGGMLKYLHKHPVGRVTVGGGIGKITKLAQGAVDLHSGRSQVDFDALAAMVGMPAIAQANTALEAYQIAGPPLVDAIARVALAQLNTRFGHDAITYDVVIIDRAGAIIARGRRMTLLILGGTGEGRRIAERLAGHDAVISLAGATRAPEAQLLPTRIGGFGGAAGFRAYLHDAGITAVLDATHPFAHRITTRTAQICADLNMPYLQFLRPPWVASAGDRWTEIAREQDASAYIPKGATVFLGTGRQTLPAFANLQGRFVICRQIDPPDGPFPFAGGRFLVGRPPFSVEDEVALFSKLNIDWLIVKNAGGAASGTKLTAARQLGIPVLMLARPPQGDWPVVNRIDAALDWAASF